VSNDAQVFAGAQAIGPLLYAITRSQRGIPASRLGDLTEDGLRLRKDLAALVLDAAEKAEETRGGEGGVISEERNELHLAQRGLANGIGHLSQALKLIDDKPWDDPLAKALDRRLDNAEVLLDSGAEELWAVYRAISDALDEVEERERKDA
jgi:hypothetical protein